MYNNASRSDFQIGSNDGSKTIYLHKEKMNTDFFKNFFDDHNQVNTLLLVETDRIDIAEQLAVTFYGMSLQIENASFQNEEEYCASIYKMAELIHLWEMPASITKKFIKCISNNLEMILNKKSDINYLNRIFKDQEHCTCLYKNEPGQLIKVFTTKPLIIPFSKYKTPKTTRRRKYMYIDWSRYRFSFKI